MQIFVLGTGRSGTHWIGFLLDSHPEIRTTIESPRIFNLATSAAIHTDRRRRVLPILRAAYIAQSLWSRPRHYADKSHPVIWFADQVAEWFPEAKFIGTNRNPYGTVASMLRHSGVSKWQEEWRQYGVPNEFLGITEANAAEYEGMTAVGRAALRWASHRDQMSRLRGVLGDRLHVVEYEDLFDNYDARLSDLWSFLGVHAVPVEEHRPNQSSRDAWRAQLSGDDVREIARITGVPTPP